MPLVREEERGRGRIKGVAAGQQPRTSSTGSNNVTDSTLLRSASRVDSLTDFDSRMVDFWVIYI